MGLKIRVAKRRFRAVSSAADAGDRGGAGTLITLVSGDDAVSWTTFEELVRIKAVSAISARTIVRFFLTDTAGGGTKDLIDEIPIGPDQIAPDAKNPSQGAWFDPRPYVLKGSTQAIKFSVETNDEVRLTGCATDWN